MCAFSSVREDSKILVRISLLPGPQVPPAESLAASWVGLGAFTASAPGLVPGLGTKGFPGGSAGKDSACNVGDQGLIPGLGRFP